MGADKRLESFHEVLPGLGRLPCAHEQRAAPLRETFVVVGWVKSNAHLRWMLKTDNYNFRMGSTPGALRLSAQVVGATYLMLHGDKGDAVPGLLRIINPADGPQVHSAAELVAMGYPTPPTQASTLVYDVEPAADFDGMGWDYEALPDKPVSAALGRPFATSLHDLLLVSKRVML